MTTAAASEPLSQPPRLAVVPSSASTLARLEDEITSLAGHLAAGTARFLTLLSEFDAAGGWQAHGLVSCAQWLSWKCGMSLTTAREHVRVALSLRTLPRLAEAFGAGKVSFSKARAISRVATAETEGELVETAQTTTASQLDRLCSGIKHVRTAEEVLTHRASATFRASWREDGMLSFSGRLSPEDGAVLLAALAAVKADPIRTEDGFAQAGDRPDNGLPDNGLPDDRYRDAAMLAARADSEALVLIARNALENPPADVRCEPVRLIVHTQDPADEPTEGSENPPAGGSAGVLDAGPGIPLLPLSPATLERLACEATVEAATDPDLPAAKTRKRFADKRQGRALLRRDGGCGFAGCTRKRGLHAHHVVHYSKGGATTMTNLLLLCDHHHLLVHEGGWTLERTPTGWVAISPSGERHLTAPPVEGDAASLREAHTATVSPETVTGSWAGDPLHLAYAVGTFAGR